MWATFWNTLHETGGRRILWVLPAMALLVGWVSSRLGLQFGEAAGVDVIYSSGINQGPWPLAVPTVMAQRANFSAVLWMSLMVVIGGPLMVAALEKGWRELTLSKGTPRWHILMGRYLAIVTIFGVLTLMTDLPVALRLWWVTGISTLPVVPGVLIQTFAFASLIAVAALASMAGENVAAPILVPFSVALIAGMLANREALLYDVITSEFLWRVLDWMYYVFPKGGELQLLASAVIESAGISSYWPVWTTGLFTLGTLVATAWVLERKSF